MISEPEARGRLTVRLGMTKGALIAFVIVLLAGVAGFLRLETVAADQHDTVSQLRHQQQRNLQALREVCRQGDTLAGLTQPIIRLLEFDIGHNVVPEIAVPIYTEALRVFQGYAVILKERPACEQITNP